MTTNSMSPAATTSYLARLASLEGRGAYDIAGAGPLIVLVPGLGDLRGAYRFLAPAIVAGNSMAAGSAVLAAARRPDLVLAG
jgi:pimeloyl-ACP methyl ester carboxylesterase